MTPKQKKYLLRKQLSRENKRLKQNSFRSYYGLISALLQEHRGLPMLKDLSDAWRRKDFKSAVTLAGSLSSAKHDDATNHFVANQFALLIRKYPWKPTQIGSDPLGAAMKSLDKGENRCRLINRKFELLMIDPSRDKFRLEGKRAMAFIRSVIGPSPCYSRIFRQCGFGSGASVGVHGDDTHLINKLRAGRQSVTPGAIHHAFGGLMKNFHFAEVFLPRQPGGSIVSLDYVRMFENYVSRLEVVDYNKLSFAEKTALTFRSIAVEPLWSGYVQKGIDVDMRRSLKFHGIDLSDQSLNQRMARQGSLDDSADGFVTVDLRNASNSNAIRPVQYLYPEQWFSLFMRTRSPKYMHEGVVKTYNMLCSMGNGFCFPVETLTFASICYACGCGQPGVDFMVYGDDIIIRKRYAEKVIAMLKHYGYAINTDKTFVEGPFRESCGTDWYQGEDVRPFTLDFALDKVQNVFKILNLSNRNERTRAFFRNVRSRLIETLHVDFRYFRPLTGPVDTGIDTTGDEHLSSRHCHFKNGVWSWSVLAHHPVDDFDCLGEVQNEPWLMGVALNGNESVPEGPLRGLPSVSFRRKTRTEVARESYASTSNWLPPS